LYSAIAKGNRLPKPSIPEGFWVLYYEMRGLSLKMEFINEDDNIFEVDNKI
jgi:DNA-directed RNA polymerase beta subunit